MYPEALDQMISRRWYASPRFALLMMSIFAGVGLILVTVGVYSVLAYTTAQRTHEIGVRMALGPERANVLRLVIIEGLRLVLAGVGVGLVVSLLFGRAVEAQLWPGVKPYDPVTLASTVVLLLATGVLACWIPARRGHEWIRWWRCDTNRDRRGPVTDRRIRAGRSQLVETRT